MDTPKKDKETTPILGFKPLQIKVSKEDESRILAELFEDGYSTINYSIIPDKIKAVLKNLSAEDQLTLESHMNPIEGSTTYILHTYTVQVLKYTLLEYGENKFNSPDDAEQFIKKLPSVILDKLIKVQNAFEQQLKKVLQFEKINDHFFEDPSTLKK